MNSRGDKRLVCPAERGSARCLAWRQQLAFRRHWIFPPYHAAPWGAP